MAPSQTLGLTLHGHEVAIVFNLLGHHENDLTYSLGWLLSLSPSFTMSFFRENLGCERGKPGSFTTKN